MKNLFLLLIVLAFILTGCNMPSQNGPTGETTPDVVATEVQRLLTTMPTVTTPAEVGDPTATTAPAAEISPTPLPSFTPLPTFTTEPPAAATPTPTPGDPAVALGQPAWKDTLDTAKNFYLYENDNTKIDAGSGALVLTGVTAIGWHGWTLTYAQSYDNFYLQGSFKTVSCGGTDLYGLVFRADKANAGYFFGATCDGQYSLYARDFNNNIMTEILSLTPDSAILAGAGQINHLGVLANSDKISLYANGVLLEEVNDGTYAKGYVGPFVAGNSTENFTYELDEIATWKLK